MALVTIDIDRTVYGDGKKWVQSALDAILDTIETQFNTNTNNNLTQLGAESWGTGVVSFDNDGVSNRTNSLYNKQSGSDTDTGDTTISTTGSWIDLDATDASVTFTPELAGKFWVTCVLHVQHTPSAGTSTVDVSFRLTDGTNNSNPARVLKRDYANGVPQVDVVTICHEFNLTAVSQTIKLQYNITTLTTAALVVAASASAPTYFHYQKI